jgi:hypothetical protein
MTRTGKIARLPREIREQLNRRLDDGEPGVELVTWLNSLPEVQAVLKAEFGGRPINEPNLTDWKNGGYRDWLDQQEAKELVPLLADEADELNPATGPPLTDRMAVWLAARLMVVVRRLAVADLDDAAKWKLLHETAADIVAFRKGDHSAERLKLEREHLAQKDDELKLETRKFHQLTTAAVMKTATDPAIQAILAGDGNNDEKTDALGRAIFGDDWNEI